MKGLGKSPKATPSKEEILNRIIEIKSKTNDRFITLLVSDLEGDLNKASPPSFINFVEFERITNLFEKENRRNLIKTSLKTPEKEQAYVFKVTLARGIWRIIEINGGTLFSEFSSIIQNTFGHEPGHLYEFELNKYKFGPECDEWEEIFDSLDNTRVDSAFNIIGFMAGDRGRFLCDFGENIFHSLKLIEIKDLNKEVKSPQIRGNKGDYKCENCKLKNAVFYCYRCRAKLCESCSEETAKELIYCSEGHYPLLNIYESGG